jgi:hypothetical protein
LFFPASGCIYSTNISLLYKSLPSLYRLYEFSSSINALKTLTLHIGTQKTGTTALQRMLKLPEVDAALKKEGICVIPHYRLPAKNELSLTTAYRPEAVDALRQFWQSEFKRAGKYDQLFLCWENFSGDVSTFHANRKIIWEQLRDSLPKETDYKLQIILFFRRQDDFMQSAYHQYKQQGYFRGLEHLLKVAYHEGFDWYRFMNDLKSVFPDAEYYPFPYDEKVFRKSSLVQITGSVLNSEYLQNNAPESPHQNIGMSPAAMEIYERSAAFLQDRSQQKLLRKKLQQYFNKGVHTPYNYLTYEHKNAIFELYRGTNARMFDKYWKQDFGMSNYTPPAQVKEEVDRLPETKLQLISLLIRDLQTLEQKHNKLNNGIIKRVKRKIRQYL